MKPKDYIKKFGFDTELKYSRNLFFSDLAADFMGLFESKKSMHPVKAFEMSVTEIEEKFYRIVIGSVLPRDQHEVVWKQFMLRMVIPLRESRFGKNWDRVKHAYRYESDPEYKRKHDAYLRAKEFQKNEREWWAEIEKERKEQFENFQRRREEFFRNLLHSIDDLDVVAYLIELGIEPNKFGTLDKPGKVDLVKRSYRTISMEQHPDRGGDSEKFIKATTAKDAVLKFLGAA